MSWQEQVWLCQNYTDLFFVFLREIWQLHLRVVYSLECLATVCSWHILRFVNIAEHSQKAVQTTQEFLLKLSTKHHNTLQVSLSAQGSTRESCICNTGLRCSWTWYLGLLSKLVRLLPMSWSRWILWQPI